MSGLTFKKVKKMPICHSFRTFAKLKMFQEDKIIDEQRQGEILVAEGSQKGTRKLFLESYGCQMNFSDSEIVASILIEKGFSTTANFEEADVIFLNTCAIR